MKVCLSITDYGPPCIVQAAIVSLTDFVAVGFRILLSSAISMFFSDRFLRDVRRKEGHTPSDIYIKLGYGWGRGMTLFKILCDVAQCIWQLKLGNDSHKCSRNIVSV